MKPAFVPLVANGAKPGGAGGPKNGSHPLGFNAIQPSKPAFGGAQQEPIITCEREGDRISKIRIQCPCGHLVELTCAY